MCGIVGYAGGRDATEVLMSALRRLEYRGYDSAGIAVIAAGQTQVVRCRGKLVALQKLLAEQPLGGTVGVGHTRWATHGRPSDENAHPHKVGSVSVVHNGIIENHAALRDRLRASGRTFSSQTDTEVIAHLVDEAVAAGAPDLAAAVRCALKQLEGAYAIAVLSDRHPDEIVAAKNASPLVVGLGQGECFLASDAPAILEYTREMIFLEEGDVVALGRNSVEFTDVDGNPRVRKPRTITWTAAQAEKAGYPHFMLKEIYEQPQAVSDTLRSRLLLDGGDVTLDGQTLGETPTRVVVLACGTSYHAGLVGKFLVENLARIPCEVDLASEFRYREPVVGAKDLVVAISQSGETLDTLCALKEAKARGARALAICNVVDSAIARASDLVLYTHAGPEIGVASTKCFTAQLAALTLLAIHLGRRNRALSDAAATALVGELLHIPHKMSDTLRASGPVRELARKYMHARDFLFLGRGPNYPIALEGALKLKEISYIHAEGYPAGEMKHGPIALIDDGLPVVVIATRGKGHDKVLSNLAEVRAREGHVIAVATRGDEAIKAQCQDVLWVEDAPALLQPLLTVLPLQLLAYNMAVARGTDVDQPRNLAKSVTVE
ncbi:MAG: glutamine--fructose-6-phosphate transaminase (isomerizing) [Deltaproteobacteria bacterium]|nr:glutamine--fructose-6-phosphate transaminase (isomerizing) [Deltaproteobacteria bacterium]